MACVVDPNALITITIKYRPIYNEESVQVAAKVLPDDADEEGMETLIIYARPRPYGKISRIQEESGVINHVTGQEMARMRIFNIGIWLSFFVAWNLYDEDTEEMVPIDQTVVSSMFDTIVRAAVRKYMRLTSGKGE